MRFAAAWMLVLAGAALFAVGAWAAKPGGGEGGPVPPGTIYFSYGDMPMQMKADGSQKQVAEDHGVASQSTYGSDAHRWSLRLVDFKLFATTDGIDWMQITNLLETDNGDGSKTMMRLVGQPSWSNDGVDSFVSVAAIHWVQPIGDPIPPSIYWDYYRCIIRLNISALEMQARRDGGLGDPLLALADAEFIMSTPNSYTENFEQHHWSLDASQVVYKFRDASQGTAQIDLYVADVGPTVVLPVDALDSVRIYDSHQHFVHGPQFAPSSAADPGRIAFNANGILYTVRPDGTGLTALCNTGSIFTPPAWSPDGQHLAFRQTTVKGFTNYYQICRISSAGGAITVLTADQSKTIAKLLTAWRQ